ncbi:alpha/beta hydrolase [Rhizobium vallis]|uniref:Alpha/beta hydrolase n=1 Tax=Rhizobium vallis TaxID=634290 RepID=A0A432PMA4_9HYPH|nr:alpha/beta hydrolase [Rhizobium vallis]RUM25610.1 alpha/beta hydrolase [Rhizobium vallis]
MLKGSIASLLATAVFGTSATLGHAAPAQKNKDADIGFVTIDKDVTLRRMVLHAEDPKGTVLFLHGFPETLFVWKNIARSLAGDYDVHAFDWPGYGQSSRPSVEKFGYAPADYARVLKAYIAEASIDRSKLTIYATDIGSLPALLAAIDEPDIARNIVVGDFAPFNRPNYMYESLQALKSEPSASQTRAYMNKTSSEILANTYRRGLSNEEQFDLPADVQEDMNQSWGHGELTSADAFYHYYSSFTRDQDFFEANLGRLKTPVKVAWGEKDLYIDKKMGAELAERLDVTLDVVAGAGHYPHLQYPERTIEEVLASAR